MPVVKNSSYRAPAWPQGGHLQTILPAFFRKVPRLDLRRERMHTPDDDFLDLDWLRKGSRKLLILSHGLEGSTETSYIKTMSHYFHRKGWDVMAWNYRGCSGEMNKQLRFYHSGATDDLELVIQHALKTGSYEHIALAGFSLGGNISLKYLGEHGNDLLPQIKAAVVFSVPCDLEASAYHLGRWQNRIYLQRFLRSLKRKISSKAAQMPDSLDVEGMNKLRTFHAFDDAYTAPMHGFESAHDYYTRCSSKAFIEHIAIPTLIVNAENDPFLPAECYPAEECRNSESVWLEVPAQGGHVGFPGRDKTGAYWPERRALEFISTYVP